MKNNCLTYLTASTFFILFSCSPNKAIDGILNTSLDSGFRGACFV